MRSAAMGLVMIATALSYVLMALALVSAPETGDSRRPTLENAVVPISSNGRGCYWFRAHHFCTRYCYYEVDGRRFCVERERDAHSQAPLDIFGPFGLSMGASKKLGRSAP